MIIETLCTVLTSLLLAIVLGCDNSVQRATNAILKARICQRQQTSRVTCHIIFKGQTRARSFRELFKIFL